MIEDLLTYYNRELSHFRKWAPEFSRAHPDVAPLLGLDASGRRDPYVERLIEAFAYLNARTRKKLDDDFPEIAEALMNVLYPHYLAPIPSMSIAHFELDPGQGGMVKGFPIERGSMLETEDVGGDPCRYQTRFPLRLYPVRVQHAALESITMAPKTPFSSKAVAVLHLQLGTFSAEGPFHKLELPKLRFFLCGEPVHTNSMYEMILHDGLGMALAKGPTDESPVVLGDEHLQPAGFAEEEGILPYPPQSFPGYRLLTEYFVLPDKFRFIDIAGLSASVLKDFGATVELFIYLKRKDDDVQPHVTPDMFRLGCSPIVNLFPHRCDPFKMKEFQSSYHIVPDHRRQRSMEVYSIHAVKGVDSDGKETEIHPFYSTSHRVDDRKKRAFWYGSRRPAGVTKGERDLGTEIDMRFVDLDFQPANVANRTIIIEATCLNRDLPAKLPFGGGKPTIRMVQGGPLAPIRCLTPPTGTRRPALKHGMLWKLISHLSLNHFSITEGTDGAAALREILSLYNMVGSADATARVEGIESVSARRETARLGRGESGFCRGLRISLHMDERRFSDKGLYLFASVIERFLGLYASINSFTQLEVETQVRQQEEVLRWPPRASDRQLL